MSGGPGGISGAAPSSRRPAELATRARPGSVRGVRGAGTGRGGVETLETPRDGRGGVGALGDPGGPVVRAEGLQDPQHPGEVDVPGGVRGTADEVVDVRLREGELRADDLLRRLDERVPGRPGEPGLAGGLEERVRPDLAAEEAEQLHEHVGGEREVERAAAGDLGDGVLHGVRGAGLGDGGVLERGEGVGGRADRRVLRRPSGELLELLVGAVVLVHVDVGDDAVDLAGGGVLPERDRVPAAGEGVRQGVVVVREPQGVPVELRGVPHLVFPEVLVGVDDRLAAGEGGDLVDPVTDPLLELGGAESPVLLEVEGGGQRRLRARGEGGGVVAGLGAGVADAGLGVVVAARRDPGGGGLGGVGGEVRVGVAGALGGLDEGEGLAVGGDGVPVDRGGAGVLVAGHVDAVEGPRGDRDDVGGDEHRNGRRCADESRCGEARRD